MLNKVSVSYVVKFKIQLLTAEFILPNDLFLKQLKSVLTVFDKLFYIFGKERSLIDNLVCL